MAANVAIGEFAGGTNPITIALGFQPKLVLVWSSFQGTYGTFVGDGGNFFWTGIGIGILTTEANQLTEGIGSDWNGTAFFAPRANRGFRGGEIISEINAALTTITLANLSAITATGFSVNFSFGTGAGFRYQYAAFGGADTTVAIGTAAVPTATGPQTVTTGLLPDWYMLINGRTGNSAGGVYYAIGQCDGTRAGVTAWQQTGTATGNASALPSVCKSYQRSDKVIAVLNDTTGAVLGEAGPMSVSATGFTINWTTAPAVTENFKWIAVNFNGQRSAYVGTIAQPSGTGLQTILTPGITPDAVFLQSAGGAASAAIFANTAFTWGLAAAATDLALWTGDADNVGGINNRTNVRYSSNSFCLVHGHTTGLATGVTTGTIDAAASFLTGAAGSFALVWTQTDAIARESIFCAFGAASAPAPPASSSGHWRTRIGNTFRAWTEGSSTMPSNLIGTRVISATGAGTYTPTTGTGSIVIELIGAGGGGGGAVSPGGTSIAIPAGGGGGAYVQKRLAANFSGAAYVVGAKGTGGAAGNNNGTAGGATTFTDTAAIVYTAGGGIGGIGAPANTAPMVGPIALGGAATNGDVNLNGQPSTAGFAIGNFNTIGGRGGESAYGVPGVNIGINGSGTSQAGSVATGKGAGGSSANVNGAGAAAAGGNGADGLIIIWEFSA